MTHVPLKNKFRPNIRNTFSQAGVEGWRWAMGLETASNLWSIHRRFDLFPTGLPFSK